MNGLYYPKGINLNKPTDLYCLGVKALGICTHDLSNPSLSFFSIGQLATVVALILTFSQLTKPIVRFRLATRYFPQWFPWIGIGITISCVFGAAILRIDEIQNVPVIGYPIFWEFIAGACFVWAGTVMILRVSRKSYLSKRNAERFLENSQSIIARGNIDDLRDYGDEIYVSISIAIKACNTHQTRALDALHQNPDPTDFERICYTLLDLWADKQLCRTLVTRCPQTAIEILSKVQTMKLYESGAYALIHELINQAFSNPDSILHREGDYSGLGRFKPFMTMAFGNWEFVTSHLRPLQAWRAHEQDRISSTQARRFGDAIEIALRSAIEENRMQAFYAALSSALCLVNDIARRAAWAITRIPEGELSQSEWSQVLNECGHVHCKVIKTITSLPAEQQPSVQVANIDPKEYDPNADHSIYAAVAKNAYEYLESLAMCKGHDDSIRLDAIFLWEEIFPDQETAMSHALSAVRQRFIFTLRRKIDQNLDIEHWFYPVVTRVLVAMWGIPNCSGEVMPLSANSHNKDTSDLYVYMYTKMMNNFVALRRKSIEYTNDLLPNGVEFVEKPPSLRQHWFRGKTTIFSLID